MNEKDKLLKTIRFAIIFGLLFFVGLFVAMVVVPSIMVSKNSSEDLSSIVENASHIVEDASVSQL